MIIDSHCHLNFPEFKDNLSEVLSRAHALGVERFLTVNTRLSETDDLIKIIETYPHIWASVGVHPHDAKDYSPEEITRAVTQHAQHPRIIALGETGLDYFYNNSPQEEQIISFEQHISLSASLNLPLIIHTRDADTDTINTLKPHANVVHGVFHCFSGGLDLARKALDLGFYLSFSGIITFKKADDIRDVVKYTPLDRMLVETDSPFLTPIPHRGKSNEPGFTRYVAEKIADIKDISLSQVADHTTENFYALFTKAHSANT